VVFEDSGEGAALLQIFSGLGGEELIDPIVAVLHHGIAEHLRHLLERLFSLSACIGHRTVVRRTIGDVPLNLRPEELDRLDLRTEGWSVHQHVASIVHQLLDDGAVVIRMLLQPLVHCCDEVLFTGTALSFRLGKEMSRDDTG